MFPESRPSELSVSAALVVSRLPIALSISSGDVAVDVVFLLGGVFDSEGCEFVAVMVLDASAPLTIEAVVTLGRSHDTGRRHSQWISKEAFTGRLFRPFATVPYCGVGRVSMINVESTQVLIRTLINSKMAYGKLTNDVVDEEREGNYVERNLPQLSVECQTPPARGRPCYRGGKHRTTYPPSTSVPLSGRCRPKCESCRLRAPPRRAGSRSVGGRVASIRRRFLPS